MARELIRQWRKDGFTLTLWDAYRRDGGAFGRCYLDYRLTDRGQVIFQGGDFAPSPCYALESDESMVGLLSFLAIQRGDTDEEYFEKYTQKQIEWANSARCEELKMIVYDMENPEV